MTRSRIAPRAAVALLVTSLALAWASTLRADDAVLRPRPSWARHFRAERVAGTAVAIVGDSTEALCYGGPSCTSREVPASTFKVANALIALETGVLSGADHLIAWDGVERSVPDWNHDMDLRRAVSVSSVPYFQEVARRVGASRMRAFARRLGYGNREIGAVVDRFWLDGPLAISPLEQARFVRRLDRGELPVSARTREVVLDVLTLSRAEGSVLRGKTGWVRPGGRDERGWFVGWLEREGKPTIYVAVLITRPSPQLVAARRAVAERILGELAAISTPG